MTVKLKFGYPRRGLEGRFATFRLGVGLSTLPQGEPVELVDARSGRLLKRAKVIATYTGTLVDMARQHAVNAHNWQHAPQEARPALLMQSLAKRYPPNRVLDTSVVTVIELEIDNADIPEPGVGR